MVQLTRFAVSGFGRSTIASTARCLRSRRNSWTEVLQPSQRRLLFARGDFGLDRLIDFLPQSKFGEDGAGEFTLIGQTLLYGPHS